MADEQQQQDKTEQPTPKRIEDARKKGDVPRSRELTMAGVMLSGASTLLILAEPIGQRLTNAFASGLVVERSQLYDPNSIALTFGEVAVESMLAFAPFALVLIGAVFLGASLIGGWSFSMKAVAFKVERINPAKGIKKVFSANSLNELVKAIAKFGLVGVIAVIWLWWSVEDLLSLGSQPVGIAIGQSLKICGVSLLIVSSGLILIAAADVPFQLWNYKKKLRMTRREVKDELKDTEGRPEVKSRIRALQQQIATRRMMEDLPTADVVVTNPTHFAVALKYDEKSMGAPRVIAKGKDLVAQRIRELATNHSIPLFSAPPLARALFRTTDIGQEIPGKLYTAVAQVLAYIFQLNSAFSPGRKQPVRPTFSAEDFDPISP